MARRERSTVLPVLLLFHPFNELYGSDRMVAAVVRAARRRFRCVVVLPHAGPLDDLVRAAGAAEVRYLAMPAVRKALLRPGPLLRFALSVPGVLVRTLRLVRGVRPAVCYVNTIVNPVVLLACRLAGRPTVCHAHEAEQGAGAALEYALTAPLALTHRIVAISSTTADFVGRRLPFLRSRTEVVYNAVAEPAVRGSLPLTRPATIRMVLPGRWSERKGTDVAIDALRMVRDGGLDVTLDVVGGVFPGYEWYEERMRALVTSSGLDDFVRFRPFVADSAPLYDDAHIVLVPSRVEPFGLVAVEGMLHGRAVLTSDAGGLVEVMDGLPAHWTSTAGSPEALASSIALCARNWAATREQAERGQRSAARRFGPTRFAGELLHVLDDVRR